MDANAMNIWEFWKIFFVCFFLKWLENLVLFKIHFAPRFPWFSSELLASMTAPSSDIILIGWVRTIPSGLLIGNWALSALRVIQYCPNSAWLLKLTWNTIMVLYCICLTSNYLILFSTHINEKCIWMKKNMNRWYTKETFIDTWVRYVHVHYLMVKDRLDSREN